ncbi:MAG: hypothetical protein DRI57_25315 [Deltaproteobacteria bacterium]|nr:MAG: hypothetical protein DRI57_25315 [Deltaproteobacteria bacterium]
MRISKKILLTTLPLTVFILLSAGGVTYYLSYNAFTDMAEIWMETGLLEAVMTVTEHENILQKPENENAGVRQAESDMIAAMQSVKVGKQGYVFAVDVQGIIVAYPDKSLTGVNISAEKWFQRVRNTKNGRIRYAFQGISCMAMYAYFPARKWYLFAAVSENEAYRTVRHIGIYLFSLAVPGSTIIFLILIFLTRHLTAPLKQLITGAERIGQGDLKTRIFIPRGDELGRLADVFNKMAARLQETLAMLQSREKLFRSLIENASGIIIILNHDGSIRYGSPSVRRVLGFEADGIVGRDASEFVHPDDLPNLIEIFAEKIQHPGDIQSEEFRVRHKDGSWCVLETVAKDLLDDPVVEGWVFNLRDVSDRNQAVSQLRESEEKYRNLFESAPEGIIITTLDGEILSFNKAFMKIFKIGDKNACPELRADDLYADPGKDRSEMIRRIKKEEQIENYEQDHIDQSGRVFPASRSLRLIRYEGKLCIQTIIRDVTRIKKMEAELRNYAENLERMVNEKTGELKSANEKLSATVKSLEETREQLALNAHQSGMAEIAVSVLHNIGNTVNSVNVRASRLEEMLGTREIQSLNKIHTLLQSEWPDPGKEGSGERKEKLLDFFSMIIGILKDRNNKFGADLEFIGNGVNHIMEIITIQQKYAGLRGYETRVSLNDLLKDSAEMLMDSLVKRKIELKYSFNEIPDILLDKNKMMQIFINILKNAYETIDMAPPENEKKIYMTTSVEKEDTGEYIQVMIRDTGMGLTSEDRKKIFRFNFSTKGRGTGYGLHDAANYIRAQEGMIDLLSEGLGKGACLIIKLPNPI